MQLSDLGKCLLHIIYYLLMVLIARRQSLGNKVRVKLRRHGAEWTPNTITRLSLAPTLPELQLTLIITLKLYLAILLLICYF